MLNSVRTRLTLWYIGVLALVLVAFSAGVYTLIERNMHHRIDTELQRTIEETAGLLAVEMAERESEIAVTKSADEESDAEDAEIEDAEIESIEELSQSVLRDRYLPHLSAAIFDSGGRLIAEQLAEGEVSRQLPVQLSSFGDQVSMLTQTGTPAADDERRVAFQRVPITSSGAAYLIVVGQSLKPVGEEMEVLRRIFYLAVPVALTLAGLGGWFLARKSLAPRREDVGRGAAHRRRKPGGAAAGGPPARRVGAIGCDLQ